MMAEVCETGWKQMETALRDSARKTGFFEKHLDADIEKFSVLW